MGTHKLNGLLHFAKNKLVVKLVLIYSTIMLIPLLITIQIVTDTVNSKLLDLEISKQVEITDNMETYLNEQYRKINLAIHLLYYSANDTESPVEMLVQTDMGVDNFNNSIRNKMPNYLNGITLSKDEILDIILLDNERSPNVYSTSNRSISNRYDFSRVTQLDPTNRRTFILPDTSPAYILGDNVPVISHIGNLYNLNDLRLISPIGKYIINLSSTEIKQYYNKLTASNQAEFYIVQDSGMILFSNRSEEIGQNLPNYEEIFGSFEREMNINGEVYILNKANLNQRGLHLLMQTPKAAIVDDAKQLINNILTVFFIGVLLVLLLSYLLSSYIAFKIKKLHNAMRSVEKGDFKTLVETKSTDEFGQLTASFNRMVIRLEDYVDKVYIAELNSKSAKLLSLQSAINPHFLYNTIESIRMKAIEENSKEISHMLYILGRLFHWRISSENSIITIEEELESIQWYLHLLKFRFQNNLETKIVVDESIHEYGIPKLLLQPIIENAFNHGLFNKDQKSVLVVRGHQCDHKIIFDIIDNGIGMEPSQLHDLTMKFEANSDSKDSDHIGITNVMQRIQVMFGQDYGIVVTSRKNYWTKVSISIPMYSRKEMEESVQSFHY